MYLNNGIYFQLNQYILKSAFKIFLNNKYTQLQYIHSVSTEWPTHQRHVGIIGVRKQGLVHSHVLFFTLQPSQTDH